LFYVRTFFVHTFASFARGKASENLRTLPGTLPAQKSAAVTRLVVDDPYVDLFSKRVSDECSRYLSGHPSPSDALGRAFFGSRNFMAENILLSSLDSLFTLYPEGAKTLPTEFGFNSQYLLWKVSMKAPLELICSYQIEGLNFRGITMVAFDPALRRAYHGNCINVTEKRIQGFFLKKGIHMHTKYAEFLLNGMVESLEKLANEG